MHELAVTESLLQTASDYAKQNNADRVVCLNLVIGELSGIIDDSVQFYWEMISENTICSQAKLNIERKTAKLSCIACGNIYKLQGELIPCPKCSSMQVKVIAGDEFLLESIEIEKLSDDN